jgi:hypothetical protein
MRRAAFRHRFGSDGAITRRLLTECVTPPLSSEVRNFAESGKAV